MDTTNPYPYETLRAHRAEIAALLGQHGFISMRIPSTQRQQFGAAVELLVLGDEHVDLGDLLLAIDAVSQLVEFEVELIPISSALGTSLLAGAEEL